jgi:hypothetical protein
MFPLKMQKQTGLHAQWASAGMQRPSLCPAMSGALLIFCCLFLGVSLSRASLSMCDIVCSGPILACVQNSRLFADSKTFVDLSLARAPEAVLQVSSPPQIAALCG